VAGGGSNWGVIAGAHAEFRQHAEHLRGRGAKLRAARGRTPAWLRPAVYPGARVVVCRGIDVCAVARRAAAVSRAAEVRAGRRGPGDLVEDGVGVAALRHHAVDAARDAHVVRVGAEGGQQH
jgi:hypothetical protein